MASIETVEPPGKDAECRFFCPPQSPGDDVALQQFISYDPQIKVPQDPRLSAASDTDSQFTPDSDLQALEPPEDSTSRTFTSFGENGTTASVSKSGHIIQIMRYFGVGMSGFFCVDLPNQLQPSFVSERASRLLENSTDPSVGIGLFIQKFSNQEPFMEEPLLDFVHDRWPRYKGERERQSMSLQYTVRDGAVIQKYSIMKRPGDVETFTLQHKGIAIRQMEWVDENNEFNLCPPEKSDSDDQKGKQSNTDGCAYQTILGSNRHSLNLIHRFEGLIRQSRSQDDHTRQGSEPQLSDPSCVATSHPDVTMQRGDDTPRRKDEGEQGEEQADAHASRDPGAVGLVIAVFLNNEAQQFGEDGTISITTPEESEYLEITVAYRLQLLRSSENGWKASLISASDVCQPQLDQRPNYNPPSFSPDLRIDFTIRRNLEHILSVCSINTAIEFRWDKESRLFVQSAAKEPEFALTCGDFAGHCIVSSASFFAFRFLLEIFKFLKRITSPELSQKQSDAASEGKTRDISGKGTVLPPQSPSPDINAETQPFSKKASTKESILYCDEQTKRIHNVCKSHLIWAFRTAWKEDNQQFGSDYWASGDPIIFPPEWSNVGKTSPSLAGTPFQIIKAFEFAMCPSDDENTEPTPDSQGERQEQETSQYVPKDLEISGQDTKLGHASHANASNKVDETPATGSTTDPESGETAKSPPLMSENEPTNWKFAKSLVASKAKPWISALALKNKRMKYAFSHSDEDGVSVFRLEDHVWIWMALKCLEEFKLDSELTPTPSDLLSVDQGRKITSKDAQKNILKRFTLEETFLKRKFIATLRTVRESRILFRPRDTALFYGMEKGFFGANKSISAPWMTSIEIQQLHEHNDDTKWENPLRYGLAMIMTSPGHEWQINQKPADIMFHEAATTLLSSARSNGLFPGKFDQESKEPLMFSYYRDSYWNSCFELPYILWTYRNQVLVKHSETKPGRPVDEMSGKSEDLIQTASPTAEFIREGSSTKHEQRLKGTSRNIPRNRAELESQSKADSDAQKRDRTTQATIDALTVKDTMPFNDFIDHSSVVEPSDEWLYSIPSFLDFDAEITVWEKVKPKLERLLNLTTSDRLTNTDTIVANGAKMFLRSYERRERADATLDDDFPTKSDDTQRTIVVDIPRSKQQRKRGPVQTDKTIPDDIFLSNERLWRKLSQMRTEQKAKKRLVILPFANKITALLCFLGDPESQHDAMIDFFDRHHGYEKYLFDDTIAAQNVWETELHLSFYQLLETNSATKQRRDVLPPPQDIPDPLLEGKKIVRAAIGFRFFGDFLDRYWTCYVIDSALLQESAEKESRLQTESGTWTQRKFLELEFLDEMLWKILEGVHDILQALNIQDEHPLVFSRFSSNDYFLLRNRWQSLQKILQVLEEDLKGTLDQIESWKTREVDRGQERPRWTKNDERKYRGPINNMLRSNERKIRKLKAYHTQIQSWRTSLSTTQQSVRDDLNLRGAEDIRFFTYVTVVFLPLGFAASIFSMSGSPSGAILNSMVVTAVTALLLTVLALLSARTISIFVSVISYGFRDVVASITSGSFLYQHYHRQTKKGPLPTKDTLEQDEESDRNPTLRNIAHGLWLCWFWVAYITQELPGRQFGIAYNACHLRYPEGTRQPTLLQWVASAFHTVAWVLQLPLKLGIIFAISVTRLVCWVVLSVKRLYSTFKYPIAFIIAVIFFPVFAISYVVNILWLNIYDTALWTASTQSTERKTRTQSQLPPKEPTEEVPTGISTQQNGHSESEKPPHQGESVEPFLLYSKSSRPFQKYESKGNSEEEVSNESETMDMRTAMRSIFDKPPRWPERKKRFGHFHV